MRNKTELKTEALLVAKYCSIIKQILNVHKQLSVNKMLFFTFLLKNKNNYLSSIYNAKTTTDVVIKAIAQISGNYDEYCKNIKYIIEAIHLLIKNEDIIIQDSILLIKQANSFGESYDDNFIKSAISKVFFYSFRIFQFFVNKQYRYPAKNTYNNKYYWS